MQDSLARQDKYNDYVELYTNGSKTHEHTGCDVSKRLVSCVRLAQIVSVFTAEVRALFIAVEGKTSANYRKAVIYTDPLSALKALHMQNQNSNPSSDTFCGCCE